MFSWIRRRATYANVAMTLALVFAMSGGAYAAKKYLITSTKQISPSVLKSLQGKAGPAGAKGPVGPAGPQGPAGGAGAKGETGTAGKDGAQGKDGPTGPAGAAGAKGAAGAMGTTGPAGSPWVAEQAPSKKILKGTWSIQQFTAAAAGDKIPVPVSTGVPVPVGAPETVVRAARGGGLSNGEEEATAEFVCPGTAAEPTINAAFLEGASLGGLCIYADAETNLVPPVPGEKETEFKLATSGGGIVAQFKAEATGAVTAYGSWVMLTP